MQMKTNDFKIAISNRDIGARPGKLVDKKAAEAARYIVRTMM